MKIDPKLKEWATDIEKKYIDAVNKSGSFRGASRATGTRHSAIQRALERATRRAALQGYSPAHDMTHIAPDPFVVRGVSTYYNKDGKPAGQWVKTKLDHERRVLALQEAAKAMSEGVKRVPPLPAPKRAMGDLCNVYTLTDCHVGMLAWHKEGGADWDLKIAEKTLVGCFEQMVMQSPAAEIGFVNQLGDFLHSDGMLPVTPTSGHVLDQDGRFSKLVQAAIRILRRIIDLALMRHKKVVVLLSEGNHDLASSIWMRSMFKALYEREPRVQVIDSELPYYAYQHGQTMLAFHHGHLAKNDNMPLLFASQFPTMWGLTTKRYAHTGHRHHVEEKEHSGITIVQHPTLAARDAYAARGGWISERQASAITYHARYGQVSRVTVTPEMIA